MRLNRQTITPAPLGVHRKTLSSDIAQTISASKRNGRYYCPQLA